MIKEVKMSKKLDEMYRAVFIISGLSDKEIEEKRSERLERDIKRAIKTIFRESGMFERVRVDKIRVPRWNKEDEDEKFY